MNGPVLDLRCLARAGFSDLDQSRGQLLFLAQNLGIEPENLLERLARAASPDLALSGLLQLELAGLSLERLDELICLAGASPGLLQALLNHPEYLPQLRADRRLAKRSEQIRQLVVSAVRLALDSDRVDRVSYAVDILKKRYRAELLLIAIDDLESSDPKERIMEISARLSDLAQAVVIAALLIARQDLRSRFDPVEIAQTRLAVIGMGKLGGRELNYISDVDVVFITDSHELETKTNVIIAEALARRLMRYIGDFGREAALWPVDVALRPEGKSGALVRTLDSHLRYLDRWAENWEFQALLKARPLAGDLQLGERYCRAAAARIWSRALDKDFIESVQRMRRRINANIPVSEHSRQLKLGPGGLRDIEFAVQLLQLVHGRNDASLRLSGTLQAIEALEGGGYIGRLDALRLARDYRGLRLLEHRVQLYKMRRTHLFPKDPKQVRLLARSTKLAEDAAGLEVFWKKTQLGVRTLHERLFYHPLLISQAKSYDLAPVPGLSDSQAMDRLAGLGFAEPRRALEHIRALTRGISRRSALYRVLLPVMLRWFGQSLDGDRGLLNLRRLSERLKDSPWFLRMLRDSHDAASGLAFVLSSSELVVELLEIFPDSARWLADRSSLAPLLPSRLEKQVQSRLERPESLADRQAGLAGFRRRETLRLMLAQLLQTLSQPALGQALAEVNKAFLAGLLSLAREQVAEEFGPENLANFQMVIMGMGRLGGGELSLASDLDVIYVWRHPSPDTGSLLAQRIGQILSGISDGLLPVRLDSQLRPEGRNGLAARSLNAYADYYANWSLIWEAQALLRCSSVAGDQDLGRDFIRLIDPVRYPEHVDEKGLTEIKRIKARVENERLPRGEDRSRHLKLGPGTISDVEWLVQAYQLKWASRHPRLKTPQTLPALKVLVEESLISRRSAGRLRVSWILCSKIRDAAVLCRKRVGDVLPSDRRRLQEIAYCMGYGPRGGARLEEEFLRLASAARREFEELFYEL